MYHSESSENCCFSCFNLQLFIIYHSLLYCFPIIHLDGLFPFCVFFLFASFILFDSIAHWIAFWCFIFSFYLSLNVCLISRFIALLQHPVCCFCFFSAFCRHCPLPTTTNARKKNNKYFTRSSTTLTHLQFLHASSSSRFLEKSQFSPNGVATSTSSCFLHSPRVQFSRRSTLTDW